MTTATATASTTATATTGATSTAAVAAATLNPHVVTTVLNINAPGGGYFSNRAACPAGTILLSGGYMDPQSDPQQDSVVSSYPGSLSSWVVTAIDVGGPLTLTIYIVCAQPNFPDVPQLVNATVANATSAQVQCPAGTTVTGGGFNNPNVMTSLKSEASANGWAVVDGLSSPSLTVFAVCQGGGHVAPGSLPTATQPVPNLGQISVTAPCPAGQSLAGGGYSTANQASAFATYPAANLSAWISAAKLVAQPPSGMLTSQAVCVKLV